MFVDSEGVTVFLCCACRPLHDAAEGSKEAVELLLRFGADPLMVDYAGRLPVHIAEEEEIKQLLEGKCEKQASLCQETSDTIVLQLFFSGSELCSQVMIWAYGARHHN